MNTNLNISIERIPDYSFLHNISYVHLLDTEYSDMYNSVISFEWDSGHVHMRLYDWHKLPENMKLDFFKTFGILGTNLHNVSTAKKIVKLSSKRRF